MFYTIPCPYPCVSDGGRHGVYIHIGVGFCVARFGKMGNAKASNRGTSNRYRLPRFFVYVPAHRNITVFLGSLEAQKLSVMRIKEKSLSWLTLLLTVVLCVGFASCDKDDDDDEKVNNPSAWQDGNGRDEVVDGEEQNGQMSQVVKDYVDVSVYYEGYAYQITLRTALTGAFPESDIKYGIEFGFYEYDYYRYWDFTGSPFSVSESIFSLNGECSMYLQSYKALKDKIAAGEKLSNDEANLMEEITEILDAEERSILGSYCGRVFAEVDGVRYFVYTIK